VISIVYSTRVNFTLEITSAIPVPACICCKQDLHAKPASKTCRLLGWGRCPAAGVFNIIRRPPAGGAGRVQIYVLILQNLKVPGAPPLPPAPPKSDPKSDSKSDPEKSHHFESKMEAPGTPKATKNHLKSAKTLSRTPPKRVGRPSLQKVAHQSLPGTAPYASRTVNTMVLALPTRCLQDPCGLHFGSILGAFWIPWAPQSHPRAEKRGLPENLKK